MSSTVVIPQFTDQAPFYRWVCEIFCGNIEGCLENNRIACNF